MGHDTRHGHLDGTDARRGRAEGSVKDVEDGTPTTGNDRLSVRTSVTGSEESREGRSKPSPL